MSESVTPSRANAMIEGAERIAMASEKARSFDLMLPWRIDEVSLLFGEQRQLDQFTHQAVASGMSHFNSVKRDRMTRMDPGHDPVGVDPEAFDVRFEFFKWPDCEWRIEAMVVLDGTAPLHEQHLEKYGDGCVVHASFKCPDRQSYESVWSRSEMEFFAEYRNSYGIFSYWVGGDYYFKPRVNLRDAEPVIR
jgi:hypothetical protein